MYLHHIDKTNHESSWNHDLIDPRHHSLSKTDEYYLNSPTPKYWEKSSPFLWMKNWSSETWHSISLLEALQNVKTAPGQLWRYLKIIIKESVFWGYFCTNFQAQISVQKRKLQDTENRLSDEAIILGLGATHTPGWTWQGRKGRPWSCRKFFCHFRFFGQKNCKQISELHNFSNT